MVGAVVSRSGRWWDPRVRTVSVGGHRSCLVFMMMMTMMMMRRMAAFRIMVMAVVRLRTVCQLGRFMGTRIRVA